MIYQPTVKHAHTQRQDFKFIAQLSILKTQKTLFSSHKHKNTVILTEDALGTVFLAFHLRNLSPTRSHPSVFTEK